MRYLTLAQAAETEITILNSRFIASAAGIQDVPAAEAFLKQIRHTYPDAHHHCYAFRVLGPPLGERFSDDGEPNGTAGRPIYTVLQHRVQNAIIVVSRYFGGTKLGTGGLVKAYTQAAQMALDCAGILEREPEYTVLLSYPYALAGVIDHWVHAQGWTIQREYGADVVASLIVPQSQYESVSQLLDEWGLQGLNWVKIEVE